MSPQSLKDQGNAAFATGDFDLAIDFFSQAIALSPSDHILYSNRSGAFASSRRYEEAKSDAERCVELNPSWSKGYARLGLALFYLKDRDGSMDAYKSGLRLDPTNQALMDGLQKAEGLKRRVGWEEEEPKRSKNLFDETSNRLSTDPVSKKEHENIPSETMKSVAAFNKAELIAALERGDRPFKEKNEIVKRLCQFPTVSKANDIDPLVKGEHISMKQFKTPQAFYCPRCDRAKISTMKASLITTPGMGLSGSKDISVCGSCYDHLTRCVIPYRGMPEYQKPEKCIHQVPRGYQKKFR